MFGWSDNDWMRDWLYRASMMPSPFVTQGGQPGQPGQFGQPGQAGAGQAGNGAQSFSPGENGAYDWYKWLASVGLHYPPQQQRGTETGTNYVAPQHMPVMPWMMQPTPQPSGGAPIPNWNSAPSPTSWTPYPEASFRGDPFKMPSFNQPNSSPNGQSGGNSGQPAGSLSTFFKPNYGAQ